MSNTVVVSLFSGVGVETGVFAMNGGLIGSFLAFALFGIGEEIIGTTGGL